MRIISVIYVDSLLVHEVKYYLQVYLNNCAHKTLTKQITDYLDENLSEDYTLLVTILKNIRY